MHRRERASRQRQQLPAGPSGMVSIARQSAPEADRLAVGTVDGDEVGVGLEGEMGNRRARPGSIQRAAPRPALAMIYLCQHQTHRVVIPLGSLPCRR